MQVRTQPTFSGCFVSSPSGRMDVISDHQLARFAKATKEDAILSDLQQVILSGWPDSKGQVPPNAQEFWNYRDELTVDKGLILKEKKIVLLSSLRGEMLEKLHEGHLGINKTNQQRGTYCSDPG